MKICLKLLVSIVFLVSCGAQTVGTTTRVTKTMVNDGFENTSLSEDNSVPVSITIPNVMYGSSIVVNYNNQIYRIGNNTPVSISNEISSWPQGVYSKRIVGSFTQGTGYFPNPTAMMNVVHILEIR